MELHEANKILRSVKAALYADGVKLPPSAETDGLMMLLDKIDCEKFLTQKIKHAPPPNSSAFNRAYYYIAFFRALMAVKAGISDPVTSMSVMLLHKTVCGDIDGEAGKPRTAEALTNGNAHTDAKYIAGSLKAIITKMNDIECSPTISKEDFAGYLTHYMRELIILHPFERGSEFTVRLFIMLFSKLKGFSMCYYRSPASMIKAAEDAAFAADDVTPLYKLILNCLSYEYTTVAQQKPAPRTRREINSRGGSKPLPPPEKPEELAAMQLALEERPAPPKPKDDDVLKRAIKLQQKITKLNEQLTELMNKTNPEDK